MNELSKMKVGLWRMAKALSDNHILKNMVPKVNNTRRTLDELEYDDLSKLVTINPPKTNNLLSFKYDKRDQDTILNLLIDANLTFMRHKETSIILIPISVAGFLREEDEVVDRLMKFLSSKKKAYTLHFLLSIIPKYYTDEEFAKVKKAIFSVEPQDRMNFSFNKMVPIINPEYSRSIWENQELSASFDFNLDEELLSLTKEDEEDEEKLPESVFENVVFKRRIVGLHGKSFLLLEVNGVEAVVPMAATLSASKMRESIANQTGTYVFLEVPKKKWNQVIRRIEEEAEIDQESYNTFVEMLKDFLTLVFINNDKPVNSKKEVRGLAYYEDVENIYLAYDNFFIHYKEKFNESMLMFDVRLDSAGIKKERNLIVLNKAIFIDEIEKAKLEAFERYKKDSKDSVGGENIDISILSENNFSDVGGVL